MFLWCAAWAMFFTQRENAVPCSPLTCSLLSPLQWTPYAFPFGGAPFLGPGVGFAGAYSGPCPTPLPWGGAPSCLPTASAAGPATTVRTAIASATLIGFIPASFAVGRRGKSPTARHRY